MSAAMSTAMNSMERTLTALDHREPDRVPLFLLTTLQGAPELGMTIKEYFSRAENVTEGQLRLLEKYRADCVNALYYAAIEAEAWGGSTIFLPDGPPLCGAPVITRPEQIDTLQPPKIANAAGLQRILETIRGLKAAVADTVPIIGITISPFSLPVMQMGFDRYIEIIYEQRGRFWALMEANIAYSVAWSNAQLAAGATAICYFDPVSSTTNIPRELFLETGQVVAKRSIAQINGLTAIHMASGRCLPIVGDLAETGAGAIGVSTLENLAELKVVSNQRLSLLGNLNGVEMRRWTPAQAEAAVKHAIALAGRGGGYLLGENHGEVPLQVPEEVLLAIRDAVERWGQYPLDWIDAYLAPS